MIASDKELKCIALSQKFHNISANRSIQKLKNKHTPIILTPQIFIRQFIPDFKKIWTQNSVWKRVLFLIGVIIIYLILLPFCFFYGLYEYILGRKQTTKRQILSLKQFVKLDYNVSNNKSFFQLWKDKGLIDKETDCYAITFTYAEKGKCIEEWFKILYGNSRQFYNLKEVIQERQIQSARNFYEQNPNGHIILRKIEDIIIDEIDLLMPNYI